MSPRLYLARHGDAKPADDDRVRDLSDLGRAQCSQMALFLGTSGLVVNQIFHSPYARTQQTAEFYAQSLSDSLRIEPDDVLKPDDPIEPVLDLIGKLNDDALLVGHYPQLMRLASTLLDCSPSPIVFEPGSIACFESHGDDWRLGWFVRPSLLGRADLLVR